MSILFLHAPQGAPVLECETASVSELSEGAHLSLFNRELAEAGSGVRGRSMCWGWRPDARTEIWTEIWISCSW